MNPIGEPDAGDRHVRFDERGWEPGDWQSLKHRAHPRLYPLQALADDGRVGPKLSFVHRNRGAPERDFFQAAAVT